MNKPASPVDQGTVKTPKQTNSIQGQPEHSLHKLLLSVRETAQRLGISEVTAYQLAKKGHLRLIKFGSRCTRIPVEDVLRLAQTGAPSVSGDTEVAK